MKAALVATVLNEAQTVGALLEAIETQSRRPDETIIVDGGSTDGTWAALRTWAERLPGLRLLEAPGSNIAQGRNRGIAAATCSIIAVTDAGCRPDSDWLARLIVPLEADATVDIVPGAVELDPVNPFEECVGRCSLTYRMRVQGQVFFPTARSMAFRRELWDSVGGFPESLDYGEDAAFMSTAMDAGAKLQAAPKAIVRWRPRSSYGAVVRQFYTYADGLAQAGLSRRFHMRTLAQDVGGLVCLSLGLATRRWPPWIVLILLAGAYLAQKTRQGCFSSPGWRTIYRTPLVLLAIHVGTLSGIITGNWRRLRTW